jgi:hypothetical protein
LQTEDDLAGSYQRVSSLLGSVAGMSRPAAQLRLEFLRRQEPTSAEGYAAGRHAQAYVETEKKVDIAQPPGFDDGPGAASTLFGRLKQEPEATSERASSFGYQLRHREPDDDVAVMAAGMHRSRPLRRPPLSCRPMRINGLKDRQSVEVGPNSNGRSRMRSFNFGDAACPGLPSRRLAQPWRIAKELRSDPDRIPHFSQALDGEGSRLALFPAEFRAGV